MPKNLPKVKPNKKEAFTLIELLLVIVILASLAVVVFVALNPSRRVIAANDARRATDADTILSAIHTYIIDNNGSLPTGLTTGMQEAQLGIAGSGCAIATGGCAVTSPACVNLVTPLAPYLKAMPTDPVGGTADTTRYSVQVDANNIVTIRACGTQGATDISASR